MTVCNLPFISEALQGMVRELSVLGLYSHPCPGLDPLCTGEGTDDPPRRRRNEGRPVGTAPEVVGERNRSRLGDERQKGYVDVGKFLARVEGLPGVSGG